jgi:hypothetical protein
MLQLAEMDDRVPLADQLSQEVGPVILINTFRVAVGFRNSNVMPRPGSTREPGRRGGPGAERWRLSTAAVTRQAPLRWRYPSVGEAQGFGAAAGRCSAARTR